MTSVDTVFWDEEEERWGQEALRWAETGSSALPCVGLVGDMGLDMERMARSWRILAALRGADPLLCSFWEVLASVSRGGRISDTGLEPALWE